MASRFALAPIATQVAFLSSSLAPDLLVKLNFTGCGTMNEAFAIIDRDYKSHNPLTVRRLHFGRCKQEKAENYTDYIVKLEAANKEGDIAVMSPQDVMCLQMLSGCQDSELLKELLKVQPCTVDLLKQEAIKYEAHKLTAGEINGGLGGHRASKVDSSGGENKNETKTCYKCYKKGHVAYNCKVKKSQLKCEFCKTTGYHVNNDYCKDKQSKKPKEDEEVAKKVDSTKSATKIPVGTPSVSDIESDDDHSGQTTIIVWKCIKAIRLQG